MRLQDDPRYVSPTNPNFLTQLTKTYKDIVKQLNGISEGVLQATTNKASAAPTAGTYQIGDYVKNSAPSELGVSGSKYIIQGWICTASPHTFRDCRTLTGN